MATDELTLLLVGNTGNGKSATGNSILRQQVFRTTASTFSATSEFKIASNTFKDVKINVVDGPGVDTDKSSEEVLNLSIENMKQALNLFNYRFSALVIVLKYGTRFTKQESDYIKFLKAILGENVIRNFVVCIITHGDNFDADNEDNNLSFKKWCQQQEGEIQNLFQECNNKCVLFNNRTKDTGLKDSQVSELMSMVPRNAHYSESNFRAADTDLQKLIIATKMPRIMKETNDYIDGQRKIMQTSQSYLDIGNEIQSYRDILNQVNGIEQKLIETYHGPDNIHQPLSVISIFKMEVNGKVKNCERTIQEKVLAENMNRFKTYQSIPATTTTNTNEYLRYQNERQQDSERTYQSGNYSEGSIPSANDDQHHNPEQSCCRKFFKWLKLI